MNATGRWKAATTGMRNDPAVAAAVFELDRVTTTPPAGALPVNVTVPVEGLPPATLAGATATLERAGGVTVSVAVFVTPV